MVESLAGLLEKDSRNSGAKLIYKYNAEVLKYFLIMLHFLIIRVNLFCCIKLCLI
jgi:hypothetical protein